LPETLPQRVTSIANAMHARRDLNVEAIRSQVRCSWRKLVLARWKSRLNVAGCNGRHLHSFSLKARLLRVNLALSQQVPALVSGCMSPTPNLFGKRSSHLHHRRSGKPAQPPVGLAFAYLSIFYSGRSVFVTGADCVPSGRAGR